MTITGTNLFFDRSAKRLSALGSLTEKLQTQITSGKRLEKPSDDALAYRRLQSIAQSKSNDAAWGKNIDLARTVLDQADATLEAITSRLQRVQELTIQANTGSLSDGDRKVIAGELRSIIGNLVALANVGDARGGPLFGAATATTAVTQDAAGVVSFDGTGDSIPIPVGEGTSVQPSDSAERIFGGLPDGSGGTTNAFAIIANIATSLETAGSGSAVGPQLDLLKGAYDQVSAVRGSVGARGARLDLESAQLETSATIRETTRSGIEDTDLPTTIVELQKASTILQATQASLAKLSSLSLFDYIR